MKDKKASDGPVIESFIRPPMGAVGSLMLRDGRSWLNQKADGGERAEGGTLPKKLCYTVCDGHVFSDGVTCNRARIDGVFAGELLGAFGLGKALLGV